MLMSEMMIQYGNCVSIHTAHSNYSYDYAKNCTLNQKVEVHPMTEPILVLI